MKPLHEGVKHLSSRARGIRPLAYWTRHLEARPIIARGFTRYIARRGLNHGGGSDAAPIRARATP